MKFLPVLLVLLCACGQKQAPTVARSTPDQGTNQNGRFQLVAATLTLPDQSTEHQLFRIDTATGATESYGQTYVPVKGAGRILVSGWKPVNNSYAESWERAERILTNQVALRQ